MPAKPFQIALRLLLVACLAGGAVVFAQSYEPQVGQSGKDVVWVPTPDVMVEKMLEMAVVTAQDFVIDLGSGDGRNVIGAARRGARGLGVEFNPELVGFSQRRARAAGVADTARFVQGDMYAADIAQANVLMLFLLPDSLRKLRPKLLALQPGSRIVSNTYEIPDWAPDRSETVRASCAAFCIVHLYVVPAQVAGTWRMPDGELTLEQNFQQVSGNYNYAGIDLPLERGRLNGAEIRFSINGVEYSGRVDGDRMAGYAQGRQRMVWQAARVAN